ncbi:MAG: GNAT family N-acetyltransferase [Desulfobacteraceae bacterium]|nr:GNAT family N-acetyltransferase [Desulfobacteraceae bacterium]
MNILQLDDPRQLALYSEDWKKLLASNVRSSSIFLTQEWVLNWWKYFGNGKRLCILLLLDGNRLAGIAPLAVAEKNAAKSPFRIVRFIGTGVADHLDFCVDSDLRREGMTRILRYVMDELSWDALDLVDIPGDSENLGIIREVLDESRVAHAIQESIVCPYLHINGETWDVFHASRRSKSTRQDLRRRYRRLSETGSVSFRRYDRAEDVETIFPQLFSVYNKRWDQKNLSISFTGRQESLFYRNVAAELARAGQLHLLTMELDGRVIAFTLSAFEGNQFTWLITAYDPAFDKYFPGEQILTQLLEDVFKSGRFVEFDFTRGDEPYKFKWTDRQRLNMRVLASNKGALSRIPFYSLLFYSGLRNRAKKSGMLRKFKLELLGKFTSRGRANAGQIQG